MALCNTSTHYSLLQNTFLLRKIRAAVIGCGVWGRNFIRLLAESDRYELYALCDKEQKQLDEMLLSHPEVQLSTTDYKNLLDKEKIDAVFVTSHTSTHFELCSAFLKAGKHVFCEKPLSKTVAEAEQLKTIARSSDRVLLVGHTFLYNSGVQFIKQYLENEWSDKLLYIKLDRLSNGPFRDDVNVLYDFGVHDLSILYYLFGRMPKSIRAKGNGNIGVGNADVVFLEADMGNDVLAHVHLSRVDAFKVREMRLVGEECSIFFDDTLEQEKVSIYKRGAKEIVMDIPEIKYTEPLKNVVQHFYECIAQEVPPRTGVDDAIRVIAMLKAAQESLDTKGEPVFLADERLVH